MQEPVVPRIEEFGLTSEDAARLSRYVLPEPHMSPPAGANLVVRWLSWPRVALLGAVPAVLYSLHEMLPGWRFNAWSVFFALLITGVFAFPLGMIAIALVRTALLGPAYQLVTSLVLPGFRAHRRYSRALRAYRAKLAEYEAYRRRLSLAFWRSLSGLEFERECAGLFQRLGHAVTLTPGTADGGVDIVLRSAEGVTAVQCKALKGKVGVGVGRELVTAARDMGAARMMIVCTAGASEPLRRYAKEKGITIVTAEDLVSWQMGLEEMPKATVRVERIQPA